MSSYVIGFNILKQFIIGIHFCRSGFSLNVLIFSLEIHLSQIGKCDRFFAPVYNEFANNDTHSEGF